jgi:hypothetical protein
MAGIDKTYIDGKDYLSYRNWWINNYDKMISELGHPIWLYTFDVFDYSIDITPEYLKNNTKDIEYYKNSFDFPIWNTSEKIDKWLMNNCAIQSFRDRMIDVYPYNWKGFKNQYWIPKPKLKQKYKR